MGWHTGKPGPSRSRRARWNTQPLSLPGREAAIAVPGFPCAQLRLTQASPGRASPSLSPYPCSAGTSAQSSLVARRTEGRKRPGVKGGGPARVGPCRGALEGRGGRITAEQQLCKPGLENSWKAGYSSEPQKERARSLGPGLPLPGCRPPAASQYSRLSTETTGGPASRDRALARRPARAQAALTTTGSGLAVGPVQAVPLAGLGPQHPSPLLTVSHQSSCLCRCNLRNSTERLGAAALTVRD